MGRFHAAIIAVASAVSGCTINANLPNDAVERAVDRYMLNIRQERAEAQQQRRSAGSAGPGALDSVVEAWTGAKQRMCVLVHQVSSVNLCD